MKRMASPPFGGGSSRRQGMLNADDEFLESIDLFVDHPTASPHPDCEPIASRSHALAAWIDDQCSALDLIPADESGVAPDSTK